MKCSICKTDIDKDTNYRVLATSDAFMGQIVVCTGCVSRAMHAKRGGIVTADGLTAAPVLVFPVYAVETGPVAQAFRRAASDSDWVISLKAELSPAGENVVSIVEHYYKALTNTYFSPAKHDAGKHTGGRWHNDNTKSPVECFRQSCVNIRDYYSVWRQMP